MSIDTVNKTMVIDWEHITLNHDIPLYLLEHPEASQEEIDYQIEAMRPPEPDDLEVPTSLLELVTTPVVDPQSDEASVREQRNAYLSLSDWIVTRSLEIGQPVPPEWVAYRQALRDITEQSGFPSDINWPTEPK